MQENFDGISCRKEADNQAEEKSRFIKECNDHLAIAIDQTLSAFGVPVRNAFLQRLEFDCNMPKNAIPANIDMFSYLLHKAFGPSATKIEVRILKILAMRLDVELELEDYESALSKWVLSDFCFSILVLKIMKLAIAKQFP